MVRQFEDKVAVIVGASSGIGQEVACLLAGKGAKVVLQGRDSGRLEESLALCKKSNGSAKSAVGVTGDITETETRKKLLDKAIHTFGKIDILIFSAATATPNKGIVDETEESFDVQMTLNVRSPFFLVQSAVPYLEKTKGNVVLVSSTVAYVPQAFMTVYAMSKHALDHMTKCLALELGPKGIRVNTTNPTITPTRALRKHDEVYGCDFMEFAQKYNATLHPLYSRCSTVKEQADAIVFLCSEQASFVTGQHLYVDGGYIHSKGNPPPAPDAGENGQEQKAK
ncbi:L-xylulose reductase [Aplysia californica]|uniref:L-xylulose reductase n=1 Tax=Aplysia californica TaxID=6500 RepID=A0ABM1A8I0_APLCA|nr:L-xylulose reductase [Aplysia californica]